MVYGPRHNTDFRTIDEIIIGWISSCEIRKTVFTESVNYNTPRFQVIYLMNGIFVSIVTVSAVTLFRIIWNRSKCSPWGLLGTHRGPKRVHLSYLAEINMRSLWCSGRVQIIVWRIWNFDTNEYPNIFVLKKQYERMSEYICIKKRIRIWYERIFVAENIRIYSNIRIFNTLLYEKYNTNEYPNIFGSKKWYERIYEYIRIKKRIRIWYERIFVAENIRISEYSSHYGLILHTSSFFLKYERKTSTFLTKIRVKYEQKYKLKCINTSYSYFCTFTLPCIWSQRLIEYDLTGSNSSQRVECALNTNKSQKYE